MSMVQGNGGATPGHTLSYASRLKLLRAVTDGRRDQGRDHPASAVPALAAATTVAEMTGYRAPVVLRLGQLVRARGVVEDRGVGGRFDRRWGLARVRGRERRDRP